MEEFGVDSEEGEGKQERWLTAAQAVNWRHQSLDWFGFLMSKGVFIVEINEDQPNKNEQRLWACYTRELATITYGLSETRRQIEEGKGFKAWKKGKLGTSLVVQWLRFHARNAGGSGLIPGQETVSHVLNLRVHMSQLRDLACHNENRRSRVPQLRPGVAKKKKKKKKIKGKAWVLLLAGRTTVFMVAGI